MTSVEPGDLIGLYATHPMNAANILARMEEQGREPDQASTFDLAYDPETEITDQNHVGGIEATRELAVAAGISRSDRVLDVGSGIGGSARVLAEEIGCTMHGVDLSPVRYRDAIALTERVGLADRVVFTQGDILSIRLDRDYDVVIGQGTFVHFERLAYLMERCAGLLTPSGRLAIEDSHLLRVPTGSNSDRFAELERIWMARLVPLETWRTLLKDAGLRITHCADLTGVSVHYFERLLALSRRYNDEAVAPQSEGWRLAAELARGGVIGYLRLIATIDPGS